jgi:hypothetical protein
MLPILLALTLILSFAPQTAKKKRRGAKPKPVAIKKVEIPDPARDAIKALRTMGTVAEIGTTYADYTKRLADVKIQVDDLLTKVPPDEPKSPYQPKHDIEKALDSYVSAAHYWQMKIKNNHSDLDDSYKELMNLAWQQAQSYLNLATKGLDKKN